MQKTGNTPCCVPRKSKARFKKRICVRLDDDVVGLGNASFDSVDWDSVGHAVNASLRRALLPFKPDGMSVRIDPFEQLVFSKRVRGPRKAPK